MYTPEPSAKAPRRRVALRFYLQGMLRYPARTLSDIALDRPLLRGGALLLVLLALAGVALGATGLSGVGQGLKGALGGAAAVPAVTIAALLVASVALHLQARSLEGWGSYLELLSALVFALLPISLLAPAALLRLLPGTGFLFFLTCVAIGLWMLRLVYLAVREAHRFTGTQAILTLAIPLIIALGIGFLGMMVAAMVSIVLD